MKLWAKILIGVGAGVVVIAAGGGVFFWTKTSAFDSSMATVYDVPLPDIKRSDDAEVIARGKHLAESISGCTAGDCHGGELSGGKTLEMGPLGTISGPNITEGGLGAAYTDQELARLIQHGLKKDGRSVTFMPAHEISWLPDKDVQAIVSYVRTVPSADKPNGPVQVGMLGKFLDRQDAIVLDVARRIDHENREIAPEPEPTKKYGRFIGLLCTGCHGKTLGGGPIPGAPSTIPIPTNITPHETGIKSYTFADFEKLLDEGVKKNGEKLNPFMPVEGLKKMNEVERKALWDFLQSVPPKEFGSR